MTERPLYEFIDLEAYNVVPKGTLDSLQVRLADEVADNKQFAREIVAMAEHGIKDAQRGAVQWRVALERISAHASSRTGP